MWKSEMVFSISPLMPKADISLVIRRQNEVYQQSW
jgi:hypothetical protein